MILLALNAAYHPALWEKIIGYPLLAAVAAAFVWYTWWICRQVAEDMRQPCDDWTAYNVGGSGEC